MKRFGGCRLPLAAGLILAGCATPLWQPVPDALTRADQSLTDHRYGEAQELYGAFHRRFPDHPAAGRAEATERVLGQLMALEASEDTCRRDVAAREAVLRDAQARVEQLQAELQILARWRAEERDANDRAQRELTALRTEVHRLRRDLAAREADVQRLTADLQRLRSVDLRPAGR